MKLKVGEKYTYYLSDSLSVDERLDEINKLLKAEVEFDDLTFTIEEYFKHTWDKPNTKIGLDIIGYYLSKKPDQNGTHDQEILSKNQEKELVKGVYKGEARYTNFSDLNSEDQLNFGFRDYEDEEKKKKPDF